MGHAHRSMRRARPAGLTLIELLIASSIMAMMAAALGALALAVSTGNQQSHGQGVAVQHARVALGRIRTTCLGAHASREFPGYLVVAEEVGSWRFPDSLVVWRSDNPTDPEGLPRFRELVIFTPDPAAPNRLLELTAPNDDREVPSPDDGSAWRTEVDALLQRGTTQITQLTDLVRTPLVDNRSRRGAVRFHVMLRPSREDLDEHEAGSKAWSELPWAQSVRGSQMGLRQAMCRIELQLMPGASAAQQDPGGATALTFFSSAAIYYGVAPSPEAIP